MGKLVPVTIQLTTQQEEVQYLEAVQYLKACDMCHICIFPRPYPRAASVLSSAQRCVCLLSACLGDSLVTGSDGRGAGVSSSPQQAGLTALRSVSCVVPPVSSCPLTVRDWERRAGSQSASPSQHSRGQRPPVIPTPAQACRDTKYNHYTLQCTVREWGWSSPRMGPPSGILEAVSDNTLVCRVWPERPQRLHHERVSRGWAGDRCQLPRCK